MIIVHVLTWFSERHELTGEASDYVVTMDSARVIAPYQEEWVQRYEERYDEEPSISPAGQQGYDYMMTAIHLLNNAGTLDCENMVVQARAFDTRAGWPQL